MTKLETHVTEWEAERREEGYDSAAKDLRENGCISGMVTHLIYYTDTVKFYQDHREEIDALLKELIEATGRSPSELFGDKWDKEDPLANEDLNQNLLAWFGFEETANRLFSN